MDLSAVAFLVLLAAVAALRLAELRVSRRHERALAARRAERVRDPSYRLIVALHVGILAGAATEVVLLRRNFHPALAAAAMSIVLAACAVRWWVIRTLGAQWSVHVVDSMSLGVVTSGPYRYVRHPNYAAVVVEMAALPLVHTAWLTAAIGTLLHLWILRRRVVVEEGVLLADPSYRAAMGPKPRFLPGLF